MTSDTMIEPGRIGTGTPLPRSQRTRRTSRGMLGLMLALMAVFAIGIAALVLSVSHAKPYLAVRKDIPIGQQITGDDLRTVYINSAAGLSPIPASDLNSIVGQYAVTNLTAGTLLTPHELTKQAIPGPGQQVVGISLKSGSLPPKGIVAGAKVVLIATEPAGQVDQNPPPPLPQYDATVVVVVQNSGNSTTVLSVAVGENDAPNVARLAADNRIVVTLAGS
jgi:SAF domain